MAAKEKDASPADAKAETQPIPVRATDVGFYGGGRKRRGDLFTIASEQELGKWMERRDTPEAQALDELEAARTKDAAKFAR
jgi:hypothetical protein